MMMIFSSATINNSKAVAAITEKTENALAMPATEVIESITDNAQIPNDNLTEEPKAIVELPFGLYNVQPVELPADLAPVDTSQVYSQVSVQPSFPGGIAAFGKFIGNTVIYPAGDRENGTSGKVIVSFVVEKDGSLSNLDAVRGPSETLKAEAVRVLKLSPKWQPGTQADKPVRVSYTVPIAFTLEADDDKPSFPGGMESFGKYLASNIKYPAVDRNAGIQGKVILTFVVEADGTLSDIKSVRSPSQTLTDEAIKVMKKSPKWNPGTKDGKAARFAFVTPVNFALEIEDGNVVKTESKAGVAISTTGSETKAVTSPSGYLQTNEVVIRGYVKSIDNMLFSQVEKQPSFQGGLEGFAKFLSENIKYPKDDRDNKVQGKVIATFTTEIDGTLSDIKAIRGPSQAMMDEAVRVLKMSPKWQPGYQNGHAVRVSYTVPIAFNLDTDDKKVGTVPGIKINSGTTTLPGTTIGIRSGSTLLTPTSPLYVIDGVVLDAAKASEYGLDQMAPG
ncbi:energy transducer TonB [Mucilaginibacter antarcticus]